MKIKRLLIFFLIIVLLAILSIYQTNPTGNQIRDYQAEQSTIIKTIDGDTINVLINGEEKTIRMLGINTPESNSYLYEEAKSYLSNFNGKNITLLRDKEDKDQYQRLLRYVFYQDKMVNLEIVEKGLGTSYILEDLKYKDKFIRAESQAREQEVGLWQKSNHTCAKCIILKELDYNQEFFILENVCSFSCNLKDWKVKDAGRKTFKLSEINSESELIINSTSVWNNDGDKFFLTDDNGLLVVYYEY